MSDQSATPSSSFEEVYEVQTKRIEQLERELAEARRERDEAVNDWKAKDAELSTAQDAISEWAERAMKAERRAAELEADAKSHREWNIAFLKACTHHKAPTQTQWNAIRDKAEEMLAAIDAALESEKGSSHE